jgi:Haem-binding domain/Cytochrome P460
MWARVGGAAILGLAAIQFIRPTISHPEVTADLEAPLEVKQILRNSCYDCHSNETRLLWFDKIVPVYWLVASDVDRGRSRLNFSEIGKLPVAQQKAALYEAVNQVLLGGMPLASYTRIHRAALVTPAQMSVLKNYLYPTETRETAAVDGLAADDAQYEKWLREGRAEHAVEPAPNGIEFPSGYQNWKAISTTDRFDNQTMRVILGNDTAIQAIADGRTNPWPDGTTFAKVAWLARDDGRGQIHPGVFFQVEFMIRGREKYSATKGWGWARWRGAGLTPYGKDAGFSAECIGCHAPLRDNDYVFTVPPRMPQLPSNPTQWNVITSLIDESSSTMSTLYGNAAAVQYARSNSQHDYPVGAELSLVTWSRLEDGHWFGARIPGAVKSVELLEAAANPDNRISYSYEIYEGSPLKLASATEDRSAGSRASYLLSLRASVMP